MNGASGKQRGQELPGVIPVDEEVTEKSGGKTAAVLSHSAGGVEPQRRFGLVWFF